MKTDYPKISIVMPVFNGKAFIEDAIKSVIDQNYPNLEYIVIDGGSTDGTVDIIKKYEKYLTYWESEPDRGQTHALNKGFKRSTGILRAWLNADEEYVPGALKCVGEEYMASKDLDLIYGDRYSVNLEKTPPSKILQRVPPMSPFSLMFYTGRILLSDATFWTKEIHKKLGELNEQEYPRYAMDVEWLLRVGGIAVRWKHIAKPLSIFKCHGMNISAEGIRKGLRLSEKIRRDYAKRNNIPFIKLVLGWIFFSIILRAYTEGFWGIFRIPKLDTIKYLLLNKPNV